MTDLVELVEIAKDDGIVRNLREKLLPHLPSTPLFLGPAQVLLMCVGCALLVVAAEECIPTIDDVLAIHPVVMIAATVFVHE